MDTTKITKKADELRKNMPSMLRDRSADLMQMAGQLRNRPMPLVVTRPRRPMWQTAGLWFAGGLATAAAVGYFFDRQRGSARRHMAYDKVMATGRDMGQWSGKKARHLRHRAMGTVAEMKSSRPETEMSRTSKREIG